MSVRSLLLFLALALLVPVDASTVEEATGHAVSYQFDGATHHDAPDGCAQASDAWSAPVAASTDGMLVAPDDVSDVFVVDVPAGLRGKRVHVSVAEATGQTDVEALQIATFVPGCAGTVLDAVNWPTPEPTPPAPGPGERQASADVSRPMGCYDRQWVFWADKLQGRTPAASIHVAWTDGSQLSVPLTYTHQGAHALYATDHALGTTLKGAWINLPGSWSGSFRLAAGPCDAVDGGAVYGSPPVEGMDFLSFTPVHAGRHVVQVTYREPAGPLLTPVPAPASVGLDLHDPAPPAVGVPGPVVVPASCHWCVDGLDGVAEKVSYRLRIAVLAS